MAEILACARGDTPYEAKDFVTTPDSEIHAFVQARDYVCMVCFGCHAKRLQICTGDNLLPC
jgi:hypothetical protein